MNSKFSENYRDNLAKSVIESDIRGNKPGFFRNLFSSSSARKSYEEQMFTRIERQISKIEEKLESFKTNDDFKSIRTLRRDTRGSIHTAINKYAKKYKTNSENFYSKLTEIYKRFDEANIGNKMDHRLIEITDLRWFINEKHNHRDKQKQNPDDVPDSAVSSSDSPVDFSSRNTKAKDKLCEGIVALKSEFDKEIDSTTPENAKKMKLEFRREVINLISNHPYSITQSNDKELFDFMNEIWKVVDKRVEKVVEDNKETTYHRDKVRPERSEKQGLP